MWQRRHINSPAGLQCFDWRSAVDYTEYSIGTGTFSIQDASSSINANLFQVNNSGGGTTLFSVGNTGNLTVATSTASATALQVKNNNGTTIFNVNTSTREFK